MLCNFKPLIFTYLHSKTYTHTDLISPKSEKQIAARSVYNKQRAKNTELKFIITFFGDILGICDVKATAKPYATVIITEQAIE